MAMEVNRVTIPVVERIGEVRIRGDAYIEGLTVKSRKNKLAQFAKNLKPVFSQLRVIAEIEGNMSRHGVIRPDEDLFSEYRKLVEDLTAKVNNDEFDLVVLSSVDRLGKAIGQSLSIRWKAYLEEQIGAAKNTVALLTNIIGNTEDIAALNTLLNTLHQEKPASDRAMRSLEGYLKGANRLVEDLQLNDNIREFLIRVTARRATLADMDQEVYDWLMGNGFARKVRISLQ